MTRTLALLVLATRWDDAYFARLKPDDSVIKGGVPPGGSARALVQPGKAMAVYLRTGNPDPTKNAKPAPGGQAAAASTALEIDLPDGTWRAEWLDPKSGKVVSDAPVSGGGVRTLDAPAHETDIALRLRKQ